MALDVNTFLAQANTLKSNWDKSSQEVEAVSAVGGQYIAQSASGYINDMSNHISNLEQHIADRNIQAARQSLERAKSSYDKAERAASRMDKFANAKGIYDGLSLMHGVSDPDLSAKNTSEIMSAGNIASGAAKMGIQNVLGLYSLGSGVIGEVTGVDPLGIAFEGLDKVGSAINETAVGKGIKKGVEKTVGKAVEAGMKTRFFGDDKYQYKAVNGKLYNTFEDAKAVNEAYGSGFDPEEIEYKTRTGDIIKKVGDGLGDAKDNITDVVNPFKGFKSDPNYKWYKPTSWTLWGSLRKKQAENRMPTKDEQEDMDAYAQTFGYSTFDATRWTEADRNLAKQEYSNMVQNEEISDARAKAELDAINHYMEYGAGYGNAGSPIRLETHADNDGKFFDSKVAFNANYERGGTNDFGGIDPDEAGFFDDSGRATPELLNYAQAMGRPIYLYNVNDHEVSEDGTVSYYPAVILNPADEAFWYEASTLMRGMPDVPTRTIEEINESEGMGIEQYFFRDPETGELKGYDLEDDDNKQSMNWIINEAGDMEYAGDHDISQDPSHLGNDWYEDEFYGAMWKNPEEDNNWVYGAEDGWMYESGEGNEDGSWWWRQDLEDWVFAHEDDNGNQWLYGNSEEAWVSKDSATAGNWNWLGQEEQVSEPAQEAKTFAEVVAEPVKELSMEEQQRAFVDDYFHGTPQFLKDHLYGMSKNGMEQILPYVNDGVFDATAMTEDIEKRMVSNFNPGLIAFNIHNQHAINSAMKQAQSNFNFNSGSGSTPDVQSVQPNINTQPVYQPYLQAQGWWGDVT